MQVSLDDFWQLLAASELFSTADCELLRKSFLQLKGVNTRMSASLAAEWLVDQRDLTRYQADMLLAGRPGPFVFGPFTVLDRIATGRLERVFRASFEGTQPVMLLPLVELTPDPSEYGQYGELAALCAAVKSPHVTRTYRATRQRGQALVVFESLSGQTLIEARAGRQLPVPTACQLAVQIALGLVAIHEQKLVHGSIAPQNVWVTPQGALMILQFPLVAPAARARVYEMPLVDYVAPELLERGALPNELTDIYSLGCLVFELIAGRPPFAGGTPQEKLARHRDEIAPRLDALLPKVPDDLAQIVDDMLQKDTLLRCQTAGEAAQVLGRFATSGRAAPPPGSAGLVPGYGAAVAPTWAEPPKQPGAVEPAPPAKPAAKWKEEPEPKPRRKPQQPVEPQPASKKPPAASSPAPPTARAAGEPTRRSPAKPAATPPASPVVVNAVEEPSAPAGPAASDLPFVVTEPAGAMLRPARKPRQPGGKWWLIGAASAAVLLLAVGVVWYLRSGQQPAASPAATAPDGGPAGTDSTDPVSTPPEAVELTDASLTANLVDDDGRTLWQSPTDGAPLELRHLPSGSQVILALRPAELLESAEGPKIIAALGPAVAAQLAELDRTLGVPLAEIEQLVIAFAADDALTPRASYVATLEADADPTTLLAAWGDPVSAEHEGKQYFQGQDRAYYLPPADSRTVVVSTAAWIPEILELEGPPLLRSSLEQLVATSDSQRTLTLLANPGFVFTDGSSLLAGQLAALLGPLRTFLGPDVEAVSLSAHLDTDLYVEFRGLAPIDRRPLKVLADLRTRWEALPEQLASQFAGDAPRPHAAAVLGQLPAMLREARNYTRSGVESRQLVMAAYLPGLAAHNLLLAAELALSEYLPATAPLASANVPTKTISAAEALARRVTLSFPRETLEGALGILAREIELPIVIQGNDLQLDGITRNQSLNNFEARQRPAAEVLRELLMLANPDGKLVYQAKTDAAGRASILITTRAAVQRRGEPPAEGSPAP